MTILLGVPDLLSMRVRVRMLLLEREQALERERREAVERGRSLDADDVGRRADERAAARVEPSP